MTTFNSLEELEEFIKYIATEKASISCAENKGSNFNEVYKKCLKEVCIFVRTEILKGNVQVLKSQPENDFDTPKNNI